MNIFFFTKCKGIDCSLQVPRFKNVGTYDLNYKLFEASIVNNQWSINECSCEYDNNFFYITCDNSNYDKVYFLAKIKEIKKYSKSNILNNYNDFTDTTPDFRASLSVTNKKKGLSSYQSEYPYSMVSRKGTLVFSASVLSNYNAVRNIVFIKNIYHKPVKIKYPIYLVDKKYGVIVKKYNLFTNSTNVIEIDFDLNNKNLYFVSKQYLGVPIFLSEGDNGQLSFEHTHPPSENISGEYKNEIVKNYREKFFEIISKTVL